MMWLRGIAILASTIAMLLNLGCASVHKASNSPNPDTTATNQTQRYSGRLSLVIESAAAADAAAQSFSGGFEIRGDAQAGELDLSTPLGSLALQLRWQPGFASITRGGSTQQFSSAQALLEQATGASLELNQLFAWLRGESGEGKATQADEGNAWQVDLSRYPEGRITAKRSKPSPAQLRLILDSR